MLHPNIIWIDKTARKRDTRAYKRLYDPAVAAPYRGSIRIGLPPVGKPHLRFVQGNTMKAPQTSKNTQTNIITTHKITSMKRSTPSIMKKLIKTTNILIICLIIGAFCISPATTRYMNPKALHTGATTSLTNLTKNINGYLTSKVNTQKVGRNYHMHTWD